MPTRTVTPGTMALGAALDQSSPLSNLLQRVKNSRQYRDAIAHLLPPGLDTEVRPGPLDDQTWSLLVSSGSAAAKLRQVLPQLLEAVRASGWQGTSIKVKVQPRAPSSGVAR